MQTQEGYSLSVEFISLPTLGFQDRRHFKPGRGPTYEDLIKYATLNFKSNRKSEKIIWALQVNLGVTVLLRGKT